MRLSLSRCSARWTLGFNSPSIRHWLKGFRQKSSWFDQETLPRLTWTLSRSCSSGPVSLLYYLKTNLEAFQLQSIWPSGTRVRSELGCYCRMTGLKNSAVAECLSKCSDIVSTGHIVHFADGRINESACLLRSMAKLQSLATLEEKASYLGHFFLFCKKLVLDIGGLDENIGNFPGIDDFDLIWTLLEHDASVSIIEHCSYHYRDHEGDRLTLSDPAKMTENLKKILRKHGVPAEQVPNIVQRHARWYGRPIYSVMGAR